MILKKYRKIMEEYDNSEVETPNKSDECWKFRAFKIWKAVYFVFLKPWLK